MFNSKLKPTEGDKDRARVPTASLIQPRTMIKYPPRADKGKEPEASNLKRLALPSSPESRKRSKGDTSAPTISQSIPIPNHIFLNRTVLKNEDEVIASEYLQGICPAPDRRVLDALPERQFTREFNLILSKALPYLSSAVARARVGYADPEKKELKALKAELAAQRSELKRLTEEAEANAQESRDTIAVLNHRIIRMRNRESEKMEAAYKKGKAEFMLSTEGLKMVDRIRDIHKEAVLYSTEFTEAILDIVPYYGELVVDRAKEWVASGKDIKDFTIEDGLYDAPVHPRTTATAEQLEMQKLSAADLVEYIHSLDEVSRGQEGDPLIPDHPQMIEAIDVDAEVPGDSSTPDLAEKPSNLVTVTPPSDPIIAPEAVSTDPPTSPI